MTKLHKSAVPKRSLIQPLKFRTWKTGLFKMTHFKMLSFQIGVFKTGHPSFFGGVKFKLDDHERTQWGVIVGALGTPKHLRNKSFTEPFFTSGFCWQPRGSNHELLDRLDPKADVLSIRPRQLRRTVRKLSRVDDSFDLLNQTILFKSFEGYITPSSIIIITSLHCTRNHDAHVRKYNKWTLSILNVSSTKVLIIP